MVIYADVLFAVNFIMDYLALYVSGKVVGVRCRWGRIAAAALVGGLYGVSGVFVTAAEQRCAVAVSLVMCRVAFGGKRLSVYVKTVVLFYAASMLFGGVMTFLYECAYRLRETAFFSGGLTAGMFFALAGILFLVILAAGKIFSVHLHRKTARIRITLDEKEVELTMLCDTGNLLRDPYSGQPAILVGAKYLDKLLGAEGMHRYPERAAPEEALRRKLRFVPIKTAAGSGVLPTFSADRILVMERGGAWREVQAVIASDTGNEHFGEGYEGLMNAALFAELA